MIPDEYTKAQALREIAAVVGVEVATISSRGGTGRALAIRLLAEHTGIGLRATTKQAMARELSAAAGLPWFDEWESRGSTIEARGWAQLLLAARALGVHGAIAAKPPEAGRPYVPASEERAYEHELHIADLDALDRGSAAHARLQNDLAAALAAAGIEPLSPRSDEPVYDLAWEVDGVLTVCEVKSATEDTVRTQGRLGLGQVLEYRASLSALHSRQVRAVLATTIPLPPGLLAACEHAAVHPCAGLESFDPLGGGW